MITALFMTSMVCAGISGVAFYTGDKDVITRRDKVAGICFGISVSLLLIIAYVAGAR